MKINYFNPIAKNKATYRGGIIMAFAPNHGIKRIPWWLRRPPIEKVKASVDKTPKVVEFMRPRELTKLPKHYQKSFWEQQIKPMKPVHYIPPAEAEQYQYDRTTGTYHHVKSHVPIEAMYPPEANYGLWGGEGVVKGFFRKDKKGITRRPHWWWPAFQQTVFYSEILDRHMQIIITDGAYELIEKAGGIDHYILETHAVDLKSRLGMRLKREMLLELARKLPLLADDPEKQRTVMKRYEKYSVPEEVAEWVGLSLVDGTNKFEESRYRTPVPLKEVFRERVLLEWKAEKDGLESLPSEAQALIAEAQQASAALALEASSAGGEAVAPSEASKEIVGRLNESEPESKKYEKASWWKKFT